MNMGLDILIERMKTNPEEWSRMRERTMGRWEGIVHLYWDYFTEEDQAAYKEARNELVADEFSEEVLKMLAGEEETKQNDIVSIGTGGYIVNVGNSGWVDPRGIFHPQTNMASINPLQQSQIQQNIPQKQQDLLKLQAEKMQKQSQSFLDSVCSVFK